MNKKLNELYLKYINERLLSNSLNNNILSINEIINFSDRYNLIKIFTNSEVANIRNKYLKSNKDLVILSKENNDKEEIYLITKNKSIKLVKDSIDDKVYYDEIEIREYDQEQDIYLKHNLNISLIDKNIVNYNCSSTKIKYNNEIQNDWLNFTKINKEEQVENKNFNISIFNENIIRQITYFLNSNPTNIFEYGKNVFKYDLNRIKENINSTYNNYNLQEMKTLLNSLKKYKNEGYQTNESDEKIKVLKEEIKRRKYTN